MLAPGQSGKIERTKIRAKGTVNRELSVLRVVFKEAVAEKYIDENPMKDVKSHKLSNGRVRVLSAAEEAKLREVPMSRL